MDTPPPVIGIKQKKPISKTARIFLFVLLGLFVLCVIIGVIANSTPSGKATSTAMAQLTHDAKPTDTLVPTETSKPLPTKTPAPTNTPLPPTPTPEPIVLTGTGDSVVDFENPFTVGIIHIIGNSSGRYFGVKSYSSNGESLELLVNTTDPYDGILPMDFRDGEHTTRFEVTAKGQWTIEILPLLSARSISVPGTITGKGDEVILLSGSKPDLAKIKGNSSGRYFGVTGYGNYSDLLINTTDPYEGTVILASDTIVLEIKASGEWSIEITNKP